MKIGNQNYSQGKHHLGGGTHRSRTPTETIRVYSRFMPTLGITRLANVTGLDYIGIPVYQAVRPNSRSLAVSQGKGIDANHAKASALMESMEFWHAENIDKVVRIESHFTLSQFETVVDVTRLPLRSGSHLRLDLPMPYLNGYDLISGEDTWVPYEFVTMNTALSLGSTLTFFNSSNGLASGNHILEASLHGLCEVVERDALATWYSLSDKARNSTKIDLTTVDDPHCAELLARYERAEINVAAWDVTSDIEIPTYAVAICERWERPRWRRMGIFEGSGTHPSSTVALARALSEAAQSRLTIITGSREDNPPGVYVEETNDAWLSHQRETFFGTTGKLRFDSRWDVATTSFEGDIEVILTQFRKADIDSSIIVDLTKNAVGVPVVKVVVPGLETMEAPSINSHRFEARHRLATNIERTDQ